VYGEKRFAPKPKGGLERVHPLVLVGFSPLATSVPKLIKTYLKDPRVASDKNDPSVQEKLDRLSAIYIVALELIANTQSILPFEPEPAGATLTIVGYENGKLTFAGQSLVPHREGSSWRYTRFDVIDKTVDGPLVIRVEGMKDVANNIVDGLKSRPNLTKMRALI
jgi:hypothetical protein